MEVCKKSLKVWRISFRTHQFCEATRNLGVISTPQYCVAKTHRDWSFGTHWFDMPHKFINTNRNRLWQIFSFGLEFRKDVLMCSFLSLQNFLKKKSRLLEVGRQCSWTVCGRSTSSWHCPVWFSGTQWWMTHWPHLASSSPSKVWHELFSLHMHSYWFDCQSSCPPLSPPCRSFLVCDWCSDVSNSSHFLLFWVRVRVMPCVCSFYDWWYDSCVIGAIVALISAAGFCWGRTYSTIRLLCYTAELYWADHKQIIQFSFAAPSSSDLQAL